MGRSVFVDDETYCKLVERAKRLNIPIGKAIDLPEETNGNGGNEAGKEKSQESEEKKEPVFWQDLEDFISEVEERLEEIEGKLENIRFCPNCGHVLYLHAQDHTSHITPEFYKNIQEVGGVYGKGGCYHLECPRCGFCVTLEKPKSWHYVDPKKQVLDLRNEEGKKGHSESEG